MQITITGSNPVELIAEAQYVIAMLTGVSAKATTVLSDSEQARLRGDATVVPPKGEKEPTAAEKKAAAKAAKAAEEAKAKAAAEAEIDGEEATDEDVLDEEAGDESEAITSEDVKKLLVEVRGAYPKDATIISSIVKEHGKAGKLSDVEDKNLPKVAAHCRELLKKAGK